MCKNIWVLLLEQLKDFIEGYIKRVIENKVTLKRHLVHPLFSGHRWLNHSWQRLVWLSLCCNLNPLLSGLCSHLLHIWRPLSCLPTVFSFVGGKEPRPFSVSQGQGALSVFLCSPTISFPAYLEVMFRLKTVLLLTLSEDDTCFSCKLVALFSCHPLPPLLPFLELLSVHPRVMFVQSVIPKCYALDLSVVKYISFV